MLGIFLSYVLMGVVIGMIGGLSLCLGGVWISYNREDRKKLKREVVKAVKERVSDPEMAELIPPTSEEARDIESWVESKELDI